MGEDVGVGLTDGPFDPRPRFLNWSFLDGCAATRRSAVFSAVAGTTVGVEEPEFLGDETMSEYDGLGCLDPEPGLYPVGVRDLLVGLLLRSIAGCPACSGAGFGTFVLTVL
jgi:hypothetical protein